MIKNRYAICILYNFPPILSLCNVDVVIKKMEIESQGSSPAAAKQTTKKFLITWSAAASGKRIFIHYSISPLFELALGQRCAFKSLFYLYICEIKPPFGAGK